MLGVLQHLPRSYQISLDYLASAGLPCTLPVGAYPRDMLLHACLSLRLSNNAVIYPLFNVAHAAGTLPVGRPENFASGLGRLLMDCTYCIRENSLSPVQCCVQQSELTTLFLARMARGSTLQRLYALLVALSLLSALCIADAVSDLQTKGRAAVDAEIAKSTTCTKDKLQVRKEWFVGSFWDPLRILTE